MKNLTICHNCGNSISGPQDRCSNCNELVSQFSLTKLNTQNIAIEPLDINLKLDMSLSDNVLTSIRLKKLLGDNLVKNKGVSVKNSDRKSKTSQNSTKIDSIETNDNQFNPKGSKINESLESLIDNLTQNLNQIVAVEQNQILSPTDLSIAASTKTADQLSNIIPNPIKQQNNETKIIENSLLNNQLTENQISPPQEIKIESASSDQLNLKTKIQPQLEIANQINQTQSQEVIVSKPVTESLSFNSFAFTPIVEDSKPKANSISNAILQEHQSSALNSSSSDNFKLPDSRKSDSIFDNSNSKTLNQFDDFPSFNDLNNKHDLNIDLNTKNENITGLVKEVNLNVKDESVFSSSVETKFKAKPDHIEKSLPESKDNVIEESTKAPSKKKLRNFSDDSQSKDSDIEDDNQSQNINLFAKKFNILGMQVPVGSILVIAIIGFFIAWQVLSGLMAIVSSVSIGSIPGLSTSPHPPISGTWKIVAAAQGQNFPGVINILDKNGQIVGNGNDTAGYFEIAGNFAPPNKIMFVKRYFANGQEVFKPIHYEGYFNFDQNPLYLQGGFTVTYRKGYGWRGHAETVNGQWEAILVKPMANPQAVNPTHGVQANTFNVFDNLTTTFTYAAFAGIGLAILLIIYSVHLFGPNGKIQISEKQRYITTQFKSQHVKMLKELAANFKTGGLTLGVRNEWKFFKFWEIKTLNIPPKMREKNPHMLILGTAKKGKSKLIANFITQDILSNDRAVVVIDSDGGLVDDIAYWIASHNQSNKLAKRVILLDPTQKDQSHTYNPLELPEDGNLQSAASSIVYGFKAIYTEPPGSQSQWNAQTANILRNSALLLSANGKTLTDLPTLLQDHDTRDILLEGIERKKKEHVEFATLLETWGQYKKLARTEQWVNWVEPILNRVTPMLSDPRIRPILTSPKGSINLNDVIRNKKILLVKIPQGQLDQNANLLGSLIVTGLKQAAISMSNHDPKNHNNTSLYLDEFDSFIEKETFDSLTSDTEKFKIGITSVGKSIQQLPEEFRNYLLIHVGFLVAFALAKKDADLLGPQMFRVDGRKRKHQTIQNFFNRVNSSPQFEMISDEEKLNIDRLIGQDDRTYFIYRVGSIAGVFHMKAPTFKEINESSVSKKVLHLIKNNH